MTDAEEQRRRHQATLVDLWRKMYDTRVFPQSDDPFHVAGVLSDLVFDNRERPHRDFTAGAGTMPLAHGNDFVAESIRELLKFFYQTGPYGQHIHGVQMEMLRWLVPYFRPDAQIMLLASENEALTAAAKFVDVRAHRPLLAVNRATVPVGASVVCIDHHHEFITEQHANRWSGYLVSPIDPETYEVLDPAVWEQVRATAKATGTPIVWDETVTGVGWTGKMFTATHDADLVVLGGAIGGGIPLGGIVGVGMTLPGELDGWGNRLGGSSLSVTAGLHTIKQVTHRLRTGWVQNIADQVDTELLRLQQAFPDNVIGLTGEGALRGIRCHTERFAVDLVRAAREDGLLLSRCRNLVRVTVPLNCTPSNVDDAFGVLTGAVLRVRDTRHGS